MKNSKQRFRGILAYDGTNYFGFQRIPGRRTVQGVLENAIAAVTQQHEAQIVAAGRTDAGVHARGQVIAFDCEWHHQVDDLWRAINANLPRDIALQNLGTADENFHPRYDAVSREYLYQFYTAPIRNPIRDYTAWHVGTTVDLE
ncbi:MAG TPA: tRNA pseudouridine synthase A, partial [Aggregatilineales bacterium]|nr:tRNA pseudouridine synthase A [Aggregatilineales bacterium]